MKRNMVGLLVLAAAFMLAGCVTGKKFSVASKEFAKTIKIRMSYSLNGYSWIKTEYSKQIKEDLKNGKIEFAFAEDGDYLLRAIKEGDVLYTTWGKQLLLFTEDVRGTVVSAFLGSAYAMVNNDGGIVIEIAYYYIRQLTAGGTGNRGFIGREEINRSEAVYEGSGRDSTGLLYDGLHVYMQGADKWQQFKRNNFHVEDSTIRILHQNNQ
jgi:hypothetical protein